MASLVDEANNEAAIQDAVATLRPRAYQKELFEKACKQNIIAFLATGAGKTLISVMLVKEKSSGMLREKTFEEGRQITIFLAPKVALVWQQAEVLQQHTDLRVEVLCGEMGVDWWSAARWASLLKNADCLVSTPMVILDALRHGFIQMAWINLLCFDEAHHATGGHPYALIMSEFYSAPSLSRKRPHIFGMTASPVNVRANARTDRVSATIRNLEVNLDSMLITVSDKSAVDEVAPPPRCIAAQYALPPLCAAIDDAKGKLEEAYDLLRKCYAAVSGHVLATEQRVWEAATEDLHRDVDGRRISCASGHTARFVMQVQFILEEMGPMCAASAFMGILEQTTQRSMYTLTRAPRKGPDLLGIADAPAISQADAWMVPIDAKMPTLAKQQGTTDRMGGPEEAEAIATALRIAVPAIAQLLVPDPGQLDRLMAGALDPSLSPPVSRSRLQVALRKSMDSVPDAVLTSHILTVPDRSQPPPPPSQQGAHTHPAAEHSTVVSTPDTTSHMIYPAVNSATDQEAVKQQAQKEASATALRKLTAPGMPFAGLFGSSRSGAPPAVAPVSGGGAPHDADSEAAPTAAVGNTAATQSQVSSDDVSEIEPGEVAVAPLAAPAGGSAHNSPSQEAGGSRLLDRKASEQQTARDSDRGSDQGTSSADWPPLVTPKVAALARKLLEYEGYAAQKVPGPSSWSCIVFAERKLAVVALDELHKRVPCMASFLRTARFMGYSGKTNATSMDIQTQNFTLKEFKAGRLNTLFSTAVAEEGLDLKACQLVVRFDLPSTLLAFVQSSGRARMLDSHMVLMVEEGNIEHSSMLSNVRSYEEKIRQEALMTRMDFGKVGSRDDDNDEEDPSDAWLIASLPRDEREYCVESTGAKITLSSAKPAINHFCSLLPSDRYAIMQPRFVTVDGFVSTILLPNNSPIRKAEGKLQIRKSLARSSACLVACSLLHKAGALTDHLLPLMTEKTVLLPRKIEEDTSKGGTEEVLSDNGSDDDRDEEANHAQDTQKSAKSQKSGKTKTSRTTAFTLQPHAPGLLRICAAEDLKALRQQAASESKPTRPDETRNLYLYVFDTVAAHRRVFGRRGRDNVSAMPAPTTDKQSPELAIKFGIALLKPLPTPLPSQFTTRSRAGHDCRVTIRDLGVQNLTYQQTGKLQRFHTTVIYPESSMTGKEGYKQQKQEQQQQQQQQLHHQKGKDANRPPKHMQQQRQHQQPQLAQLGNTADVSVAAFVAPTVSEAIISDGLPTRAISMNAAGAARLCRNGAVSMRPPPSAFKRTHHDTPSSDKTRSINVDSTTASKILDGNLAKLNIKPQNSQTPTDTSTPKQAASSRPPSPNVDFVEDLTWAADSTGAWFIIVPLLSKSRRPASGHSSGGAGTQEPEHRFEIDWKLVEDMCQGFQALPDECLKDRGDINEATLEWMKARMIVTCHNGMRYHARHLHPSLTVDDKMPEDGTNWANAAKYRKLGSEEKVSNVENKEDRTFRQYFKERWGIHDLRPQRMLVAERFSNSIALTGYPLGRRSAEAKMEQKDPRATVFLPPQLCSVHPLPFVISTAAWVLPHILWWLQGLLTARELLATLAPPDLEPHQLPKAETIMEALTGTLCCQRKSYERMETLGDTVLKFCASEYLHGQLKLAHEGMLSGIKDTIVANSSLSRVGHGLGLHLVLNPPLKMMTMQGALPGAPLTTSSRKSRRRPVILREKVLADVFESLTGAFFLAGGLSAAKSWLRSTSVVPPKASHAVSPPKEPVYQKSAVAAAAVAATESSETTQEKLAIEQSLQYQFKDRTLLAEALTHCSWPHPGAACYQRLEFLGDAIVDLLVTLHIFHSYPNLSPGRLHDLRSASVNNDRLAACAAVHRLHAPLRHFSQRLLADVTAFLDGLRAAAGSVLQRTMQEKENRRRFETAAGRNPGRSGNRFAPHGRQRPQGYHPHRQPSTLPDQPLQAPPQNRSATPQQSESVTSAPTAAEVSAASEGARLAAFAWATDATFGRTGCGAPKVLADLLESLIGAVYLDCGRDLDTVWRVLEPLLQPFVTPQNVPIHPARKLHELCGAEGLAVVYRTRGNVKQQQVVVRTPAGLPPRRVSKGGAAVLARDAHAAVCMDAMVGGEVLGSCENVLTKQAARMLSAEDALQNWDKFVMAHRKRKLREAANADADSDSSADELGA